MAESEGKLAFKGGLAANGNGHTNGNGYANGNGNGNGKGKYRNAVAEIGGFGLAELAAEGTWIGIALIAGLIPKAAMETVTKPIGKILIDPILDPLEKITAKLCKLKECQPDYDKPREERATRWAELALTYGLGIWASLKVKLHVRRWANSKMYIGHDAPSNPQSSSSKFLDKMFTTFLGEKNVSPAEKMIFISDEISHYAAMYLFNNQLAPVTDKMIAASSTLLQNHGMNEDKANEISTAIMAYGLPNAVGGGFGSAAIALKHLTNAPNGWLGRLLGKGPSEAAHSHVERLALNETGRPHISLGT